MSRLEASGGSAYEAAGVPPQPAPPAAEAAAAAGPAAARASSIHYRGSSSTSSASLAPAQTDDERQPLLGEATARHSTISTLWTQFLRRQLKRAPPHKRMFKKQEMYEGLDYEENESEVTLAERQEQTARDLHRGAYARWIVLFLIGVTMALIATLVDTLIIEITTAKFNGIAKSIKKCIHEDCMYVSFGMWMGVDILLVVVAACMVIYYAPTAAGSGIPEVKCYLNGLKIPQVVRLKTLLVKIFGVALAVSGGLAIGKEGPMIHAGAVVAAGVSQGKSTSIKLLNIPSFDNFRNDVEKRDFVSAGVAAGIAAAFGAPIGGALLSLEEGASFYHQPLIWRIFFCAMTATFALNVLLSGVKEHAWGQLSNPGLLNLGQFVNMPYSLVELPIFMFMGFLGGGFGALFVAGNERLIHFRSKYVTTNALKLFEAIAVAAVTVSIVFLLVFVSSDCLPLGEAPEGTPLQFFCGDNQYNAMASLVFNTPENCIKNLYHATSDSYNVTTLFLFFATYLTLATVSAGISVPSGLFIPSMVMGAAFGRLLGTALQSWFPNQNWVEPGKYALVGSAAMLGGVTRMMVSLTVIIIEATGDVAYGLPIMVALVCAKWTGDYFTEGIYEMLISMKHMPILNWEPPMMQRYALTASEIMTREVHCARPLNRVGDLYNMLTNSNHNAYPVIAWDDDLANVDAPEEGLGTFYGMVLRSTLILVLKLKAFGPRKDKEVDAPVLTMKEMRKWYPRWPTIDTVRLTPDDLRQWVDLRPYMNPTPYLVFEKSSLSRIFRLFRTMGLRHLPIVNSHNQLVGMVTRKDLANITNEMRREDFIFASRIGTDSVRYLMPEDFEAARGQILEVS